MTYSVLVLAQLQARTMSDSCALALCHPVCCRRVCIYCVLQDGRHLCLECLDTLVVDTKDAQPLYDEVSRAAVQRPCC
jgi:hypothetical protein